MELWEAVGKALRKARRRNGLTQKQLAAWSGISRSTIANTERGQQRLCFAHLLWFSRELDFSLDSLKKWAS